MLRKMKVMLAIIFVFSLCFLNGCEFFAQGGERKDYAGYVKYEGIGLANVKIKDKVNTYATTDENGYFSFSSRKETLTIFAERQGYNITPKSTILTASNKNISFNAVIAESLTGKLNLVEIHIKPTSIISLPSNNFTYLVSGKPHLKINTFSLFADKQQIIEREYNALLIKNQMNNILKHDQSFEIDINDGKLKLGLSYILKVCYNYDSSEAVVTEPAKYITINSRYFDSNLDDNDNIKFYATGINSVSLGFSYDIYFTFKFSK